MHGFFPLVLMRVHGVYFTALLLLLCPSNVVGAVNRTIDDTQGDSESGSRPVYVPATGFWEDATCRGCAIQPDPAQAFKGTWTAGTYNPTIPEVSISLSFTGERG